MRDGVLVALVPGTSDLPERCVRTVPSTPELDAALGARDGADPRPEPRRRASRAGHGGARGGPRRPSWRAGRTGAQAPALTLLALLAWWRGDGARARLLLDGALDADADYHLAELLDDALMAAIPPGWVRHAD